MKNYGKLILSRLLDQYERSKQMWGRAVVIRRIYLGPLVGEFPEYNFQNEASWAPVKAAAEELKRDDLVDYNWVFGREEQVIYEIWLNPDRVEEAYKRIGRISLKDKVLAWIRIFEQIRSTIKTPWIRLYLEDQIEKLGRGLPPAGVLKKGPQMLDDLLTAFLAYDKLPEEGVPMRDFSRHCYQDAVYFERNMSHTFFMIAEKFDLQLSTLKFDKRLNHRDVSCALGIPYQTSDIAMSGDICLRTSRGDVDFLPAGLTGMSIPDQLTKEITQIKMERIKRIVFIENKPTFEEYALSAKPHELVVHHGRFCNALKLKFYQSLAVNAEREVECYFWGDLDASGLFLFVQLAAVISELKPYKMGAREVADYAHMGLHQEKLYTEKLSSLLENSSYKQFKPAIEKMLELKITIEQAVVSLD